MAKKNTHVKPFGGANVIYSARLQKESIQDRDLLSSVDYIERPLTPDGDDAINYYNASVDYNAYHARCLRLKSDVAVGLGVNIVEGNETKIHDRLRIINAYGESFHEVISRVMLDYETTGNGYIEVVTGPGGLVNELYFLPSVKMYRRPRNAATQFYYQNQDRGIMDGMPAYDPETVEAGSSVLCIKNNTQGSLHYGLPDWRGCIPDVELDYYATLYNRRFFINTGIPDLAIVVEGGSFDKPTQDAVSSFLVSNIKGFMNAHRTLYLPVSDPDVKVRFERLGMEMPKDASFEQLRVRCRDNIVSSHGVYPRLVGIVSSGQLGGGGEAAGQLKTFQEIFINPRQSLVHDKLLPIFNNMGEGKIDFAFEKMDTSIQEPHSTYYPAMISCGVLTIEKSREELGYEADMPGDEERKAALAQQQQPPEPQAQDKFQKALSAIEKVFDYD